MLIGLGAACCPQPLLADGGRIVLRSAPVDLDIGGKQIAMSGFNNSFPGPEIRVGQDEMLSVRLENALEEGTMIHWHGIRLPNAMDGVNVLTQDAVIPGGSFDYRFAVPDAGTFWYHSHYLSLDQVSRGLFGPLIVTEHTPPDIDQDITVQLFDILTDVEGRFESMFDPSHYTTEGRLGNMMTAFASRSDLKMGERVRLRIINPAVDRVFRVTIDGLSGLIMALDGMPLADPLPIDELVIAPGQRVDVIGDVVGEVVLSETTLVDLIPLTWIAISGSRQKRVSPIPPLPLNRLPRPGPVSQSVDLVMQGGAGGPPHGGFGGWAFNDVSGLPRMPLLAAKRGETVRLRLRNETAFVHGIHLHGHHFWETDINGAPTVLRDTTLVEARDTREILCVLDNPGAWLIHCHMLSHQEDGMATWLQVA